MDEVGDEGPVASLVKSPAKTVQDDDLMVDLVDSQVLFDGVRGSDDEKGGLGNDMESFDDVGVVNGKAEAGVEGIQDVPNGINAGGKGVEVVDGEEPAKDLDSSVWNPGIDGGAGVSSVSSHEEENCVDKEEVTPKDDISGEGVAGDGLTYSGKDHSADVEIVDEPCDRENVHHVSVNSLDNPAEAVHKSRVVLVRTEESISTGSIVMDTNVDDHCSQPPEKCEPVKDGLAADGKGSLGNSSTDTQSPSEVPNQVEKTEIVGGHVSSEVIEDSGVKSETQVPETKTVEVHLSALKFEESGLESETKVSCVRNDATLTEGSPILKQEGNIITAPELDIESETRLSDVGNDATPAENFLGVKPVAAPESSLVQSSVEFESQVPKTETETETETAEAHLSTEKFEESGHESETQVSDVKFDATPAENFPVVNPDGDNLTAPESSLLQSSVEDTAEWAVMDIDEVIDFKDEDIVMDVPDSGGETGDFVGGERNEQSYTLDIPGTTDKKGFMDEPSVAVVAVELATESQVIAPVSNPFGGRSEKNYNRVNEGVSCHAEDSLLGNNSVEVSGGIDDRADLDVLLQNDCAEMNSKGDGENVAAAEQHPGDRVKKETDFHQSSGYDAMQVDIPEFESNGDMAVGEQYADDRLGDQGKEDLSSEENISAIDQLKLIEAKPSNSQSSVCIDQPRYLVGSGNGEEFFTTDLVWGKIRNHPWWPGQIFDPSDASDKAVKHYKKDCFLVAYFGDQTFAWNDASVLKPFRQNFSQIVKQSSSEAFHNAVSCALDEVSRRVMLGLSCPCISRDARERIECQVVENTGIREESSRSGADRSTGATSFEPDKLLQYIQQLAQSPQCSPNRLELVLAEAQLSAFGCFKGYREPPRYDSRDANFETGVEILRPSDGFDQPTPNDDLPKDSLQSRKERRLSELMGDGEYAQDDENDGDGKALRKVSVPSGKKRKAMDSINEGSDRSTSFYAAKVSTTSSSPKVSFKVPKITFKVGDCIRRVASQLTGSAPGKGANEQTGAESSRPMGDNSPQGVTESSSVEEILSQLQLAACEPKKGYNFLRNITAFFSGYRKSVVKKHASAMKSGGGRKRKAAHSAAGATGEYEFDDVNDSYWKDRVVQNQSEEQILELTENGARGQPHVVAFEPTSFRRIRGNFSRKRYSFGNQEETLEEQRRAAEIDKKRLELPAELLLTFIEGDALPSDIKLNQMFKRFGPLKESETKIDYDSHQARVVFKRGADAQAAYSSVGRINIFGSIAVSYQLNYSPFNSLPVLLLVGHQEAT